MKGYEIMLLEEPKTYRKESRSANDKLKIT